MTRQRRMWDRVGWVEGGLASVGGGLCLLAMLVMTVVSVFGRYVLGVDLIPGTYNIIERVLFPLLVFWALPLAHREGTFPRLTMLDTRLSPRMRAGVGAAVLVVESVVFAVLTWYVGRFSWEAYADGRQMQIGTSYWPMFPVLVMLPLAFFLMWAEMVRLALVELRKLSR
jgi:TRAP-type C4-dicarboxylate transport system permease small subunit